MGVMVVILILYIKKLRPKEVNSDKSTCVVKEAGV